MELRRVSRVLPLVILVSCLGSCHRNGLVGADFSIAVAIERLEPIQATIFGGETISVVGRNFEPGATLLLDGAETAVTRLSDTVLTFVAPAHAGGVVGLQVRVPDGRTGGCQACFEFVPPQVSVTAITPSRGPTAGGTAVAIAGDNLPSDVRVFFGEAEATVLEVTRQRVRVRTPAHAVGPVTVRVQTPEAKDPGAQMPAAFRYHMQEIRFEDRTRLTDLELADVLPADVDGDGADDLIFIPVVAGGKSSVHWRAQPRALVSIGDGRGSFRPPVETAYPIASTQQVHLTEVCDWDRDGRDDLLVVVQEQKVPGPIMVLPGQAAGTLGPPQVVAPPSFPSASDEEGTSALACGDFDGDGKTDLAILGTSIMDEKELIISFGDGQLGERARQHHPMPANSYGCYYGGWIAVGDYDGDGLDDVAVKGDSGSAPWVRLLTRLGTGTPSVFHQDVTEATGVQFGIIGGDFDGDGLRDLLHPGHVPLLFAGDGAGGFSRQAHPIPGASGSLIHRTRVSPNLASVTAGQVVRSSGYFSVTLMGLGDKGFTVYPAATWTSELPQSIAVLDANADPWPDAIVVSRNAGADLFFGSPAGLLGGRPAATGNSLRDGAVLADLDGDGLPEVIGVRGPEVTMVVLHNTGKGAFESRQELDITVPGATALTYGTHVVGNVNGDGYPDVVIGVQDCRPSQSCKTYYAVLLGRAGGTLGPPSLQQPTGPGGRTDAAFTPRALCDVTGDGHPDVFDDGNNDLFPGDGNGGFGPAEHLKLYGGLPSAASAVGRSYFVLDVNKDGICEFLVSVDIRAGVFRYAGSGQLQLVGSVVDLPGTAGGSAGLVLAVADLNADSSPDMVTRSTGPDQALYVYANDGTGRFGQPIMAGPKLGSVGKLLAGDVDGDGLTDLVAVRAVSEYNHEIRTLWNTGSLVFELQSSRSINASTGIVLRDLDGDRLADLMDPSSLRIIRNASR